jgi:hypothetical protein
MKKKPIQPKPKTRRFTDAIEDWMVGQPADKGGKTRRIRKGEAAKTRESNRDL